MPWMRPSCCVPTRGSWCPFPTGIAVYLRDPGYAALILPARAWAKHGIVLGNLVGLIDSDYQGQLMVSAWNRSDVAFTIEPMERLAQNGHRAGGASPVQRGDGEFVATERGAGGYGSTGTA